MTEEKEGKIKIYGDDHLEAEAYGSSEFCGDILKKYKQDIKKEKNLSKSAKFNDAQQGAMFDLNDEDKKIINFIKDFFDKNNYYPIPKQVLDSLKLESPKNRTNYITRDKMKKLSSFLEFKGGDYKGKRIGFTKKFLELK